MKVRIFITILLIPLLLSSCGWTRELKRQVTIYDTYAPTPGRLPVYQSSQQLPKGCIQIGNVTVSEGGLTKQKDCTYEACIEAVQEEAKKMGGQFIYVVKIKEPDMANTLCYHIIADIYRYKNKK